MKYIFFYFKQFIDGYRHAIETNTSSQMLFSNWTRVNINSGDIVKSFDVLPWVYMRQSFHATAANFKLTVSCLYIQQILQKYAKSYNNALSITAFTIHYLLYYSINQRYFTHATKTAVLGQTKMNLLPRSRGLLEKLISLSAVQNFCKPFATRA